MSGRSFVQEDFFNPAGVITSPQGAVVPPCFLMEVIMALVIVACCITGWVISRPVVRVLGI
jgi:hypothetical protein